VPPLASPRYAFKQVVIEGAPDDPGVYALYFGDDLLYIGLAQGRGRENPDTIRSRVMAHLEGELKPSLASHYKWEISSDPQTRLAEISRRLGPKLPPYNKLDP
jgi:hypothetical protein